MPNLFLYKTFCANEKSMATNLDDVDQLDIQCRDSMNSGEIQRQRSPEVSCSSLAETYTHATADRHK